MLRVEVIYCPGPGRVDRCTVEITAGATLGQALQASGLLERHPDIDRNRPELSVWGRRRAAGDIVREGDRVEVCRPLAMDPKQARRQRQRTQRAARASRAGQATRTRER